MCSAQHYLSYCCQHAYLCKGTYAEPDQEAICIAALEQEMKGLQEERAKAAKLRQQLEQAAARLEQDQASWTKRKASALWVQFPWAHKALPCDASRNA